MMMIYTIEGQKYDPIPFSPLSDEEAIAVFLGTYRKDKVKAFETLKNHFWMQGLCPKCHASDGEPHKNGCPDEVCPHCFEQLVNCESEVEYTVYEE